MLSELQEAWTASERSHINVLEMTAVLRALTAWGPRLEGRPIRLVTDSTVTAACLRRFYGGNARLRALSMAVTVAELCRQRGIKIVEISVIKSELNVRPDLLSRRWAGERLTMEFPLSSSSAAALQRLWGREITADLFATAANRKAERFFSLLPHPEAAGTDALSAAWRDEEYPLINPPFGLLSKVVSRLRWDRPSAGAILVTPDWPHAPWWPTATAMAETSVALDPAWALDFSPTSASPRRAAWPWRLRAWRIAPLACPSSTGRI